MADVGRPEVVLGLALDERLLHPVGCRAPHRLVRIVVEAIHVEGELALAPEVAGVAVAEPDADVRQREQQLVDLLLDHRGPGWGN
jgi:hypothetical protein